MTNHWDYVFAPYLESLNAPSKLQLQFIVEPRGPSVRVVAAVDLRNAIGSCRLVIDDGLWLKKERRRHVGREVEREGWRKGNATMALNRRAKQWELGSLRITTATKILIAPNKCRRRRRRCHRRRRRRSLSRFNI